MMRERSHNLKRNKNAIILGVLSVLFFINGWWFLGLIFTAVAVSRLMSGDGSQTSLDLESSPEVDSRKWGVQVPRDREVRDLLTRVYRRHRVSVRRYPHMKETFDSLLSSMWENLSLSEDALDWKFVLRELLKEWSIKPEVHMQELKQKIQDARLAAQQWSEARQEAWGLNSH
ncbi:MAG: hypothetical protein KDD43_13105 [Bdellovibrionales bacterium]|nr:hypothetical protein [Bdellovibrionales bacterium]